MSKFILFFISLFCGMSSFAKNLGVVGESFPVAELSFLHFIEQRLAILEANGQLDKINQEWLNRVEKHTDRPFPLGLKRVSRTKSYFYTPKIKLSTPINDAYGRSIYPAGTEVNALEELPNYSPCWLFFNADDEAQLSWAKQEKSKCTNPKLILTGGSILSAEKALNEIIYFDQFGRISQKLGLIGVPSKVSRQENRLRTTTFSIKENGDVI